VFIGSVGGPVDPRNIYCEVTGFLRIGPPAQVGQIAFEAVRFHANRRYSKAGTLSGTVSVDFSLLDTTPRFDTVIELFGPGWTHSKLRPSPHLKVQPSTGKGGNARIEYVAPNSIIQLHFNPRGALATAIVGLHREE
jgi:hypothetical protein